jgi:hypothetical protein
VRGMAACPFTPIAEYSDIYTAVMKKITLSVDENVLAAVRRHATERNCTVNGLVRADRSRCASGSGKERPGANAAVERKV